MKSSTPELTGFLDTLILSLATDEAWPSPGRPSRKMHSTQLRRTARREKKKFAAGN